MLVFVSAGVYSGVVYTMPCLCVIVVDFFVLFDEILIEYKASSPSLGGVVMMD
jgi:hypothetical protein